MHKKTKAAAKRLAAIMLCAAMVVASMTVMTAKTEVVSATSSTSSTLVWSDEFNGTSLDTSKWQYETGAGGWGNNEYQYYTDRTDNVYVSDGVLHIKAQQESYNGSSYTSGRINTNGKFNFTYGYVEARIALPSCTGIWPAFWMLGSNIGTVGWPACGEIDIMEAINTESTIYGSFHWYADGTADYTGSMSLSNRTEYHVYALEWDDEYMRMYCDGTMYQEMYIGNNTGSTEEFQESFYILLNVAVCGNWPGFTIDDSALPQEMLVDYVRVYQENPNYTSTADSNVDDSESSSDSSSSDSSSSDSSSSVSSTGMGMTYTSSSTATAYVNDSSWADIHYSVNGGSQLNVRMDQSGSQATYTISGLSSGDVVTYWFTYSDTSGYTQDTSSYTYTHTASSLTDSSTSSSTTTTSTSTGDIVLYQDIYYGGTAVSIGLGSYTLSDLISAGFSNDELSSIEVPFGYKVTLYEDDNFSGETLVITSDTEWIGSDWNDRVSSIVVEKAIYLIKNKNSGTYLDCAWAGTTDGTNIQICAKNGNSAQMWYVTENSDSSYTITSVLSGLAVDVDGWSTSNNANVQLWTLGDDQANQQFWITEVSDGYSSIINKYSNLCLDVQDWGTSDGTNVQQYEYYQQDNQLWMFELAN